MEERNRKRMSGRGRLAGSYTVEASLIFSVLLMVLVYVLSTTEYLTDSVRMTAILAERTVDLASGRGEEIPGADSFFRLHGGQIREEAGGRRVTVSCSDVPAGSRFGEEYRASFSAAKRKPVSWMRRMRLLQALAE